MASAKRDQTLIARRQDLIQGTIKSIAALGFSNSTVQTICESASVSRGLIGHYFDSKDALLLEAFRHLCDKADAEMREEIRAVKDDPLERLLAATRVTFQSASSRDNALVWMALCSVAPWNPAMSELHHELYRRYRKWIARLIGQAASSRGLEIDAKRAALAYAQMVDGFWIGWLMHREAYTLEDATEIVNDWLLGLFGEKKRKRPDMKQAAARTKAQPKRTTNTRAPHNRGRAQVRR